MVELTVPYESRMEEARAFKEGKYMDLTKELKKDRYEAKVMPVEIGARGFVGSSAYGLLSKLSIGGNKRTKALRLLSETAESSSRWIWSRRNERCLVYIATDGGGYSRDLEVALAYNGGDILLQWFTKAFTQSCASKCSVNQILILRRLRARRTHVKLTCSEAESELDSVQLTINNC
ncbi:reverse transcriptase [Plakobranchus ocellatus]|uniref:Reverse transcriptase n=1 Tax=Plakobranchus ocellatus TaxID=259542 RepID=A0AAV4A293_9GAST|nr:reverse transcriptase [Plakobranchus ocellatus]